MLKHLQTIYRGYDIRGKYPEQLNADEAYLIGRAVVVFLEAKTIAVGRDARTHSPILHEALVRGITDQGADVIDIGIVNTPMLYFASGEFKPEGGCMITASHMGAENNGIKICRDGAVPVGIESGLREIEKLVRKNEFEEPEEKGTVEEKDIKPDFYKKVATFSKNKKKMKVVIDAGNGMGGLEIPLFEEYLPNVELVDSLYGDVDCEFPNHESNPIKYETLKELQESVVKHNADLGIAFDGDADRLGFVDEKGEIVTSDMAGALIARELLKDSPGATFTYDLRSSKSVPDTIEKAGGKAVPWKVGHAFIKEKMNELDALFGLELVGHYFFKDMHTAEAGSLSALILLNLIEESGKLLSELIEEIKTYHHSGEINSEVTEVEPVLERLQEAYKDGEISTLDGVQIVFPDWWALVRPSANDPVIRLTVESADKKIMESKRDELLALIRK